MKEVAFSIPVTGVVRVDGDTVTIIVNKAETDISLTPIPPKGKHISLEPGMTLYDVVLEAAGAVVRKKRNNRFSAPELYHEALEKYPQLKRNSFMTRVIACTANHPSYKHYASRRDYFSRIGIGQFALNEKYRPQNLLSIANHI